MHRNIHIFFYFYIVIMYIIIAVFSRTVYISSSSQVVSVYVVKEIEEYWYCMSMKIIETCYLFSHIALAVKSSFD